MYQNSFLSVVASKMFYGCVSMKHIRIPTLLVFYTAIATLLPTSASAFDELNGPQTLIYDTNHFDKTTAGNTISYNYIHIDTNTKATVEDNVTLIVKNEKDNIHRDLSVVFLTDERKLHLPDFNNRRGNPVIIGMLEHLAQTMGRETGGGALYFRNRFKDKLADDSVEVIVDKNNSSFSFSPFANDPYVADQIALTESIVNIEFNEDIPGQLKLVEFIYGPKDNSEGSRRLEYANTKSQ